LAAAGAQVATTAISQVPSEGQLSEPLERLYTLEEAGEIVRRSHWQLRKDIALGRLRCVRIGRRVLLEISELRRLIEEGRQ
jgi:hypothetical protein